MRRALVAALAAVMLLHAGMSAQDDRSEIEAPWDEAETMTIIETGLAEVAGVPDEDFCRAMQWLLQAEDGDTATCARLIGEFMGEQAWIAESWLPLVFEQSSATAAANPVKISGKGSKNTKPFKLAAGDYHVRLNKSGCDEFTYGYLKSTEGGSSASSDVAQEGYIYGIDEGRYYWDAEASDKCKWTYVLTPLE